MMNHRFFRSFLSAVTACLGLLPSSSLVAQTTPEELRIMRNTSLDQLRLTISQEQARAQMRIQQTDEALVRHLSAPPTAPFPTTAAAGATPSEQAQAFLTQWKDLFTAGTQAGFETVRTKDRGDRSFVRMQQKVGGIPVLGGEVVVQVGSGGGIEAVLSQLSDDTTAIDRSELSLVPTISQATATESAITFIQGLYASATGLQSASATLALWDPKKVQETGGLQLVWQVMVETPTMNVPVPVREAVLVNAHSGDIIYHNSGLYNALDRKVTDDDTSTVRNEGDAAKNIAALDEAYDNAGTIYNFYKDFCNGRDSYDNNGAQIVSTVRASSTSSTGTESFYQDGYQVEDVMGHEFTHAVTNSESKIGTTPYYKGEPGAINEAFSDIFGEWIDQVGPKGDDSAEDMWLLGEDMQISEPKMRSMKNPPTYSHPDRKGSSYWSTSSNDNTVTHTNNGVGNKLAYLLCAGDKFNNRSVFAMGSPKADKTGTKVVKLFYECQTDLLSQTSDYAALANALAQAATNQGLTQAEKDNIDQACYAVEIKTGEITLPVALDYSDGDYTSDGDIYWYGTSVKKHDDTDAARSGHIPDSGKSELTLTLQTSATVSFWWACDSESGKDKLNLYVDGTLKQSISGSQDWVQVTQTVEGTGEHTIKWAYEKDASGASGEDCGWLDEVSVTSTGTDTAPPSVKTYSPADGATGVEVAANLVFTFKEAVTAVSGKNIVIKKTTDNSVVETIAADDAKVSISSGTVTVNPTNNLTPSTDYHILIDAGAFKDSADNTYAGISDATTWNFTTAADSTAPTVSAYYPAANANNVSTNTLLVLTFSEPVTAQSGKNITLKNMTGTVETIAATDAKVSGSGTSTIVINPAAVLTSGMPSYVLIDAGAFKDAADNDYAGIANVTSGPQTWSFTAGSSSDSTAPTVSTYSPADGATGVSCSADLTLTFSDKVLVQSGKNFVIKKSSGDSTVATLAADSSQVTGTNSTTITLNPASDLDYSTGYYVQIDAGAVTDLAGNNYAGISDKTTWNFTTEADTTAPVNTSGWPKADTATTDGFTVRAKTNEAGTAYYVVLADGATAPTAAEVKAATGSGGAAALKTGNFALTADTEATATVTGLTSSTAYDVYVVAQDAVATPNLQTSATKVDITTASTPIESWRNTHWSQTANTDNAANDADPDADGIVNLLEYALTDSGTSLDPKAAGAVGLPTVTVESSKLKISFKRNTSATDLKYEIEASDDLTIWTPIAKWLAGASEWSDKTTGVTATDSSGTSAITDSTELTSSTKRFLRLKVTAP
jgi:Zn-dependent metalloprotease/methionine-rich copper-binding protein CopC